MKKEYEMKERLLLNFSDKQSKDLAGLWAILIQLKYGSLRGDQLDKINPEWLKQQIRLKKTWDIDSRYLKEGETNDYGMFKIKKAKKGFVISISTTWRVKGYYKDFHECFICEKKVPLNQKGRCKKCKGKPIPLFKGVV